MTKFRIAPLFGCLALATGFGAGLGSVALAQSDPTTQQIIERLTPPVTRGIRVPGASAGAGDSPTPQQPVQPAPVFTPSPSGGNVPPTPSPGLAGPGVPPPPVPPTQQVPVVAPGQRPAVPAGPGAKPGERTTAPPQQETTAGAGAAAISLAVFFPSGSATLTPQAERELAPLGRALNAPQLATFRFRIEGHTDSVGDPASNQALSERRAAAVRAYLIQRWGVSPDRLQAVGLGESQLLIPTPDETPNPRNRRVQVINLDS